MSLLFSSICIPCKSLLQLPHVLVCRYHHSLYPQREMFRSGLIHECDKYRYRQLRFLCLWMAACVIKQELVSCGLKMATWFAGNNEG